MSDGESSGDPGDGEPVPAQAGSPEPVGGGSYGGAPDDQEMPLSAHIEEMIRRFAWVIVVLGTVSALAFPFANDLINFLWYSFLPGDTLVCPESSSAACPRVYDPLALLLARIKVASLVGFIAALPVLVYQSYLFMRPGLYPHERRYYLASVPTSLVLAFVGVAFAYFIVLPLLFGYFMTYSEGAAAIAFGLTETFNLMLLMIGLFAAIFQIPLFMMLGVMMGVTSRRWLQDKRLYFWAAFAGIAFVFNPDLTGMAPIIVLVTMVLLYEMTLLLLRWTGR